MYQKFYFQLKARQAERSRQGGHKYFLHVSKDKMYFCFLVWLLRKTFFMHPFKLINITSPVLILFPVLISSPYFQSLFLVLISTLLPLSDSKMRWVTKGLYKAYLCP